MIDISALGQEPDPTPPAPTLQDLTFLVVATIAWLSERINANAGMEITRVADQIKASQTVVEDGE